MICAARLDDKYERLTIVVLFILVLCGYQQVTLVAAIVFPNPLQVTSGRQAYRQVIDSTITRLPDYSSITQ